MAERKPSGSKKQQTVRERSRTADKQTVSRRKQAASGARKPFQAVGRGAQKVARPLKPLAKPFQTKPAKFVGRVLAKVLLINYFVSSWRELKQVTWPDRKTTVKLTIAVFLFAIVFGAIIALADYGLDKLFHKILLS